MCEKLPETNSELFAFCIHWELVDDIFIEKKIRPYVERKINEYLSEKDILLVDFICEKINNKTEPQQILKDLKMVEKIIFIFNFRYWMMKRKFLC